MLVIENVHFSYNNHPVFKGLSLTVQEGELIGLVGPNGAGKTSLLKLVSGLLHPKEGEITLDGLDLSLLSPASRAKSISVVPQNPQLPRDFRVSDVVLMGRNPHLSLLQWESHRDLEVVTHAMQLTDTFDLANRPISSLSGGEQQRVQVAMAVAQEARLMLLDEPTSNLDIAHQTTIMDMIFNVQTKRSGALIMAMHDLTLAAQYCDRLVLISQQGTVYADGSPKFVLNADSISDVYGARVTIVTHPQYGTPVVLPLSDAVGFNNSNDTV